MGSLLRDLIRCLGHAGWQWLRTLSGDDAYECHLAREPVPLLSRREFYDRRVRDKWDRLSACARSGDTPPH